jgi:hypothetical protein
VKMLKLFPDNFWFCLSIELTKLVLGECAAARSERELEEEAGGWGHPFHWTWANICSGASENSQMARQLGEMSLFKGWRYMRQRFLGKCSNDSLITFSYA